MPLRNYFAAFFVLLSSVSATYADENGVNTPFTVEYYYKVKWGYYDEWLELYKKNHWPILIEETKAGHLLDVKVHQPHRNMPEAQRWDLRVTITYRNVLVPHRLIDSGREALVARLFPNRELHDREERRRFELLEGLWDAELAPVATDRWPTKSQ